MMAEAGAGRNDVTHDHVFLEAAEHIDFAHRRCFGENTGRVLEAGGAEEALGFERRLRDTEEHRGCFGRLATLLDDAFVLAFEDDLIDLFAPEEDSVARFGDTHLTEHLAHDDFDVLVVNGHTLQAVNFLHFVDQVFLQFLRPADIKNFVRHHWTFGELLALLNKVALEDDDVLADRHEVLFFHAGLRILDHNGALTANGRAEVNDAVDLRDFRSVLWTTRFEQL